jgi:hypothetical protein
MNTMFEKTCSWSFSDDADHQFSKEEINNFYKSLIYALFLFGSRISDIHPPELKLIYKFRLL